MIKQLALLSVAVLAACAPASSIETEPAAGTTFDLYFLSGQSNMDGFGYSEQLPETLRQTQEGVWIYAGNSVGNGEEGGGLGSWAPMTPGYGTGFWSNGEENSLSDRFGPELPFAARLRAQNPDRQIAIIKASRGGTSLALGASGYGDWAIDYNEGNGRNSYDNALTAISRAMSDHDIDGDGRADRLNPKAIIWMQGESDAAHTAETAAAYEGKLRNMMNLLRAALHTDDLPVVIGQIKDSGDTPDTRVMTFSPEVIAQQNQYVQSDPCAEIVTVTERFSFPDDDPWHYLSDNYLELGEAFADAALALDARCGSSN